MPCDKCAGLRAVMRKGNMLGNNYEDRFVFNDVINIALSYFVISGQIFDIFPVRSVSCTRSSVGDRNLTQHYLAFLL